MFNKKVQRASEGLEKTIDSLLKAMEDEQPDSDEYAQMADQVVKLYKLKEVDASERLSPDQLALVIGNLLGIILIVGRERAHVVTSKAMLMLLKVRI